jgi:hypothetical protein
MNPQTSHPYKIIGVKRVFVITEISSATLHPNGYRNTTMSTISSTAALKCNSKGKNYTIGKKLTCANSLKEAHVQCAGQQSPQSPQREQCTKCAIVYEKSCALL